MDALHKVLAEDARIEYALVFGSSARGTAHEGSDLDIAVGLEPGTRLGALARPESHVRGLPLATLSTHPWSPERLPAGIL